MPGFLRMIVGLALLPACWAVARALADCIVVAAGSADGCSAEFLSLLGGMAAFVICWFALPRMVRAYVLGHELTHALWGLAFGAVPSRVKVGAGGGSVRLSKTNMIITLAPYFFPFYTFVVIVLALVTCAIVRPLPFLPLWMFLVGLTWAFHVLFTIETLAQRQPDVALYGRIFSWTFIFIVNVLLVVAWLACTTSLTFTDALKILSSRVVPAYYGVWSAALSAVRALR